MSFRLLFQKYVSSEFDHTKVVRQIWDNLGVELWFLLKQKKKALLDQKLTRRHQYQTWAGTTKLNPFHAFATSLERIVLIL